MATWSFFFGLINFPLISISVHGHMVTWSNSNSLGSDITTINLIDSFIDILPKVVIEARRNQIWCTWWSPRLNFNHTLSWKYNVICLFVFIFISHEKKRVNFQFSWEITNCQFTSVTSPFEYGLTVTWPQP